MKYRNYTGIDSKGHSWTTCYDFITDSMQRAATLARSDGRMRYITMDGKVRLRLTKAEKAAKDYYIVSADQHAYIHPYKLPEYHANPVFTHEANIETSIWG